LDFRIYPKRGMADPNASADVQLYDSVLRCFRKHHVEGDDSMDWKIFCEVLHTLDPTCTESQLEILRHRFIQEKSQPPEASSTVKEVKPGIRLEAALSWILKPQSEIKRSSLKKQRTNEFDEIEALRVRTASGAVILTLDLSSMDRSVMQLRQQVGEKLGRCVDEVKLIAFDRQLEDGEVCQDLVSKSDCLEVMVITQEIPQLDGGIPVLEQLDVLKQMIMTSSLEYQIDAATHLRKVLSVEVNPPIDQILELGVAPRLLELSQQMATPQLQFETLWAVLNIVSGNGRQTQAMVDLNAVPILLQILRESPAEDVKDQAVWAIGNIAGDSQPHRDLCIANDGVSAVLSVLQTCTKAAPLRNAMWTVSNFFRGTPKPNLDDLRPALPEICRHLRESRDQEILTDALWSLSYISDGPNNYIQAVIDTNVVPRVVELLSHESTSVGTPALRTVGNLVTGDDTQTDTVLNCNPFGAVMFLMSSTKMKIRKECCWLLSNICAGPLYQVQQIRDHGFFERFTVMARDEEMAVRKEAAFAIANASERTEVINDLLKAGCMTVMHELLDSHDNKLQDLCLTFIINLRKGLDDMPPSYRSDFLETFRLEDLKELLAAATAEGTRIKAADLIREMEEAELEESKAPAFAFP